jgi:hypothetical protein
VRAILPKAVMGPKEDVRRWSTASSCGGRSGGGDDALTGGVAVGLGSWSAVIEEDVEAQFSTVLDGDRRQQRWLTTTVQMRGAGVGEAGVRVSGSDGARERNGVGLLLLCPRSG